MEYFDVTLMKDSQGLGITIAGYVGKDNTPGRLMVGLGLDGYWLVLALAVKCRVTNIDRSSYMSDTLSHLSHFYPYTPMCTVDS